MYRDQNKTRCAFTGIEIPLDAAYVLDLPAAQSRVERIRGDLALLERMVEQLGGVAKRTVDAGGQASRQMVVVSGAVAGAFQGGIAEGLFIPFSELRRRQDAAAIARIRRHPILGPMVKGMDDRSLAERLTFGRRVHHRIGLNGSLSRDARTPVDWATGIHMFGATFDEAANKMREAITDGTLTELGVPKEFGEELRAALNRTK